MITRYPMRNSLKYLLRGLNMSIIVTSNPETKRFTIDCSHKGITTICSASLLSGNEDLKEAKSREEKEGMQREKPS